MSERPARSTCVLDSWTRRSLHLALLVTALILLPGSLAAQETVGSIEGTILDASGQPIPYANITVEGPGLIGVRGSMSLQSGAFRVPALPVGMYRVTISHVAYQVVAVEDVGVRLGETTTIGIQRLEFRVHEMETLVVSARRLADPRNTAASTTIPSELFSDMPIDRDVWSIALLAPQVAASNNQPYAGGPNVGGATELENAFYADGINTTDIVDGRSTTYLPYNFIREVKILSGGYEAEFGSAQGGVINTVTRSGGSEFSGELYGFGTSDALRATPRWGQGQEQVDDFTNYDVGMNVGGPLFKDRLRYFLAYNPNISRNRTQISGIPAEDLSRTRHSFAAKLSWSPGTRDHVVLSVLGDPTSADDLNTFELLDTVTDPGAVQIHRTTGTRSVALQAWHQEGPVLFNGIVSHLNQRYLMEPRDGRPSDVRTITRIDDYTAGTTSGGVGAWEDRTADRTSLQLSAAMVLGSHSLKVGYQHQFATLDNDEAISWLIVTDDPDYPYAWYVSEAMEKPANRVGAAFVQDSWDLGSRVRLNLGLRWEAQHFEGSDVPTRSITDQWAPRFGIVFHPDEAGRSKIALSAGRFYQVVPLSGIGVWNGGFSSTFSVFPDNPLVDPSGEVVLSEITPLAKRFDSNLQGQHHDEISMIYERWIDDSSKFGVRGVHKELRRVIEDAYSSDFDDFVVGNPGHGILGDYPEAERRYQALEFSLERMGTKLSLLASYVLSRNKGNYAGLFYSDEPELGYPPNSSGAFDFPSLLVNGDGRLPNDRTHIFKITGAYRFERPFSVGSSLRVASGTPRNEFGTTPEGYRSFVLPRGTAGATPWTWTLDLRMTYTLPQWNQLRPKLIMDVFNLGNQREPVRYDDYRYNAPANPDGTWPSENPFYGSVQRYQEPLSGRLGLVVGF